MVTFGSIFDAHRHCIKNNVNTNINFYILKKETKMRVQHDAVSRQQYDWIN